MIRTLALLAPLLLGGAALAQTIDLSQGGPVDITANDGIEWRQAEQVVVARGGARAERAGTAVDAARLLARYRPLPGAAPASPGNEAMGGSNEIWRLEAEGNVRISTATDVATGDRAVYDMDQSVLVLSGRNIGLTTPQQTITARDSLEYWTQRRMAVARGNALVVTEDGRRITADVLVAYLLEEANNPQAAAARTAPRPGTQGAAAPPPGQGRLDRVELFGNVEIRSAEEVVRGDRGVYSAETGQARLLGNVRITRGQNQINGQEALVNLNTGVSRLVGQPGQRVQGVVAPGARDSTLPGQGARP